VQKQLQEAETKLTATQSTGKTLLREEVTESDIAEIISLNMKMVKRCLKFYFTEEAWTDFETRFYKKVLEENETYRFCSYTIHGFFHYSILNLVCAITSEEFRFFRVKEHPFPAVYLLQWAKKEAARNFFFYQDMSHLIEG
jgi:hypothetical protein